MYQRSISEVSFSTKTGHLFNCIYKEFNCVYKEFNCVYKNRSKK